MKKGLCFLSLVLANVCYAQAGGTKADKPETRPAAAETSRIPKLRDGTAPAEAPKPIAVDELFSETWENHNWALKEIARIEGLRGQVEIPISIVELRKQVDAKRARMRAWMIEHKVPENWLLYDDGEKKYFGPPAPIPSAPAPAPKAEEKKP